MASLLQKIQSGLGQAGEIISQAGSTAIDAGLQAFRAKVFKGVANTPQGQQAQREYFVSIWQAWQPWIIAGLGILLIGMLFFRRR